MHYDSTHTLQPREESLARADAELAKTAEEYAAEWGISVEAAEGFRRHVREVREALLTAPDGDTELAGRIGAIRMGAWVKVIVAAAEAR